MESQNDLQLSMGDSSLRDDDNDPWGTNEHSCSQCGERFREPLDLLAHAGTHAGQRGMKRSSGAQRDKSVDCNVCGERFPDKMALISHRHIHSGNSKQFPCRECGKNHFIDSNIFFYHKTYSYLFISNRKNLWFKKFPTNS